MEYQVKYDKKRRHYSKEEVELKYVLKGKIEFLGMIRGHNDEIYLKFYRQLHVLEPNLMPRHAPPQITYVDPYTDYEYGIRELLRRMGPSHARYLEALTFQQRLNENIAKSRQFNDTPERESIRAEIINSLNRLSIETIGTSFSSLCMKS